METKQEHYESMMQAIARYAPSADLEVIQRAYAYADEKHKNQLRKSGEPYIIHLLAVAEIVAEIGLDTDAIAAALLHDCLEDTDASFEEISRLFGETVANLVEGVTKLTRVQYSTMEEQQMENLRKMFMAMSKDIRVILIKISDRLHNTRTLQYQTPAKQISKSMETMEVYAPLAHRLGMQKIKWELEDTSLQYLDPEGYQEIIDYLKKNEDSANSFMNAIQSKITTRLASVGIHGSIYGRIKHTYSIYRKMRAQNKTIDELKAPVVVEVLHTRYPQGAEKQLCQAISGRQVPSGKLPADAGCCIFNLNTTCAIYKAVYTGMPVVSKVVTVSGSGVIDPKNLECPIGTPITALFDACGGLKEETYKLIMGGPMMGLAQYNLDVTVGKGTGAMLAFAGDEEQYEENPQCIRCGKCVGVCPMRLEPVFMYKYLMKGDVDTWQNTLHGMDCIECGACAYTCPARLPLTHAFRMGKQKVNNARMAAKAKAEAEKAAAEKKEA